MKKLGLLGITIVGLALVAQAQKNKVTSTYGYLKYNELDKAKEAIDAATEHASTSDWWKTWEYRAQTYTAIAASEKPEFQALSDNPIREAHEAYQKALSYEDERRLDKKELKKGYFGLGNLAYRSAAGAFEGQDFNGAADYFALAAEIKGNLNVVDSVSLYNAALAYEKAGNTEKSLEYIDKCLEISYSPTMMINKKVGMLLNSGDTTTALSALEKGMEEFPGDPELAKTSFNLYFNMGETEKAFNAIDELIKADSDNHNYYFIRAVLRESIDGNEDKAVADYKKAIELKDDHFDSYYNLGALYFNKGANMVKEASELPLSEKEKYDKLNKEGKGTMESSLPYLEKAHELKPEDKSTILSLKQIYTMTGNAEKAVEMNKKLQGAE